MRRMVAVLVALGLSCAQPVLADSPGNARTEKHEGGRGKRFWTGVTLLVGGVGLAAAGAVKWDNDAPSGAANGTGSTSLMPPPGNATGNAGGSAQGGLTPGVPPGSGHDPSSFKSNNHTGAALALGTGIAAVGTGLALVLTSHRHQTRRAVRVEPGLARLRVVWSF